jgi:NAD+ synthase (glutamine-hydrolysing)
MTLDIAIVQFRPRKAKPEACLERIAGVLGRVAGLEPTPELLVFPETSLTGYFLEGGVGDHAWPAARVLEALDAAYAGSGIGASLDVAIGFYELHEHRVYNSSLYVELGASSPLVRHIHRKVFLPTYGVFQEERFVESGDRVQAFDTRWGRAAMLICEDAWHSVSGMLAALDGAQLILIPSASPARGAERGGGMPRNVLRWHRIAQGISEEHGVFTATAQLVGFEGGKGFAGGSIVYDPHGHELARGPLWEEAVVPARLELDDLLRARVEQPLLADLERALPRLMEARRSASRAGEGIRHVTPEPDAAADWISSEEAAAREGNVPIDAATGAAGELIPVATESFSSGTPRPGDLTPLEIDGELVADWLTRFLRDEVVIQRGFKRAVVAISGGVDSSVTAALAARALGPDAVTGLLLPYRTSSAESGEHASLLAERLGIGRSRSRTRWTAT